MLEVIHYVDEFRRRVDQLPRVTLVGLRQDLKSSPAGQALDRLFCTVCHCSWCPVPATVRPEGTGQPQLSLRLEMVGK